MVSFRPSRGETAETSSTSRFFFDIPPCAKLEEDPEELKAVATNNNLWRVIKDG